MLSSGVTICTYVRMCVRRYRDMNLTASTRLLYTGKFCGVLTSTLILLCLAPEKNIEYKKNYTFIKWNGTHKNKDKLSSFHRSEASEKEDRKFFLKTGKWSFGGK